MGMKIILKNDLVGKNIRIKESNPGIFRTVTTLAAGQNYHLRHDPHATYREYFLIMVPDKRQLRVLTSDDFNDYREISVYEANGIYDWRGVPRNGTPMRGNGAPVRCNGAPARCNGPPARGNVPVNPPVPSVRDVRPVSSPVMPSTAQTSQERGKIANFFHKIFTK